MDNRKTGIIHGSSFDKFTSFTFCGMGRSTVAAASKKLSMMTSNRNLPL